MAVCPEGKELRELPSGRCMRAVYLIAEVRASIVAVVKASAVSACHGLRETPCSPPKLIPSCTAIGANWR